MTRPPLPPFTAETAARKARLAEDAGNTRDPAKVALGCTLDSIWRNRAEFIRAPPTRLKPKSDHRESENH